MLDIGDQIKAILAKEKAERLKTTSQLMLGEFILQLESVTDKTKKVIFDNPNYMPINFDSWRGVYEDLMLEYDVLDENKLLAVSDWIEKAKECLGKTFTGYKGGDFTMGKNTILWVSQYASCGGFKQTKDLPYQAVVGIEETESVVVILTEAMDI